MPSDEADQEYSHKELKFAGIILRRHLCILLKKKDFFKEKPRPNTRKPAADSGFLYNDHYALSYRDMESTYPRFPPIDDIVIDAHERNLWMDLTPYFNPTPYVVNEQTPVPRAFRLFRSLGLRHLVVLNRTEEICGIITRKDLTAEHLKSCLEALTPDQKAKIQDYFTRGRTVSRRFEDVEKALIALHDNS